jgi:hypothetical protein
MSSTSTATESKSEIVTRKTAHRLYTLPIPEKIDPDVLYDFSRYEKGTNGEQHDDLEFGERLTLSEDPLAGFLFQLLRGGLHHAPDVRAQHTPYDGPAPTLSEGQFAVQCFHCKRYQVGSNPEVTQLYLELHGAFCYLNSSFGMDTVPVWLFKVIAARFRSVELTPELVSFAETWGPALVKVWAAYEASISDNCAKKKWSLPWQLQKLDGPAFIIIGPSVYARAIPGSQLAAFATRLGITLNPPLETFVRPTPHGKGKGGGKGGKGGKGSRGSGKGGGGKGSRGRGDGRGGRG